MTHDGSRGDAVVAGGFLVVAMLFGGGSALFPLYRLIVEVVAIIALGWFILRPWQLPTGRSAWTAIALILATFALLTIQLVPLPAATWQALPGRGIVAEAYAAIGTGSQAAPISLDPSATRDTIAFFIVPAVAFVASLRIGRDGQMKLLALIAAGGLLNGLLIVLQFQGMSSLTLFVTGSLPGVGLFANKNHSAMFLIISMPAVAYSVLTVWKGPPLKVRRWLGAASIGFMSLTVFGCLSRAGLAMLPVGLATSAMILAPRTLGRRQGIMVAGGVAAAGLLAAVVLPQTQAVARALERFDAGEDLRYQFWPTVLDAVRLFSPVGSGFGTFREVFAMMEPITILQSNYINHAHSDYLEIVLEGGLAALALVVAFFLWFAATAVARLWRCRWRSAGFVPIAIACAGMATLLLHSILDYPLRTLSLASIFAVYAAILALRPTALDLAEVTRYGREQHSGRLRR